MKRFVVLVLAFLAAAATAAPREITAEYTLTTDGLLVGRISESFQRNGERYSIESVTRSDGALKPFYAGNITARSEGRVGARGLQPIEFGEQRPGNGTRDVHARFDWEKGVMRSEYRGERRDVALPGDTQDRLSAMYQFMNVPLKGDAVELHMANGRKVERHTYRFAGEARLSTPAGEFDTVRYERVTRNDKEKKTQVWLAKDRFNFPVRVVIEDPKGLRLEQTLVSLAVR